MPPRIGSCRRSAATIKSVSLFHRTKVRCYRMPPLRGYRRRNIITCDSYFCLLQATKTRTIYRSVKFACENENRYRKRKQRGPITARPKTGTGRRVPILCCLLAPLNCLSYTYGRNLPFADRWFSLTDHFFIVLQICLGLIRYDG